MKQESFDAVILANGEYPTAYLPLKILADAPFVACCDGAADNYISKSHIPDIIIGDGDSLSDEHRNRYNQIFVCISEQETNDLTKAVSRLLELGKHRIAILGATGKREDHTIGNICLLIEYLRMGADIVMYTDYGIFIPCRNTRTFKCRIGQQVSIFNISARNLKSTGLKYPIYDFNALWQGCLNSTDSNEFTIEAEGDYIVYINNE